jgi:hypothetical protein
LGRFRTGNYGVIVIRRYRLSISGGSVDVSLSMRSWQSDTAPEFVKPRIGTQAVQAAVCVQINRQYVRALIVRALKPPECLVLLSKPCIDD